MAESENCLKFDFNGVELDMVRCPAGTFLMGSPDYELIRLHSETPHQVTISKDFYIGRIPVTQGLYKTVTGNNPSTEDGNENFPVESVSWFMAKKFCDKLNELSATTRPSGYKFDLPTEAQWEYACRAGTTTTLNNGKNITTLTENCPNLDEVAWYSENSYLEIQPVGQKKPNAWGIYDMHGCIWEWCRDYYESYKSDSVTDPIGVGEAIWHVVRGGYYGSLPIQCRSDNRESSLPSREYYAFGFRVALVWQ